MAKAGFDILLGNMGEILSVIRMGTWEFRIPDRVWVCDQSLYGLLGLDRAQDDEQFSLLSQYFPPSAISKMTAQIDECIRTGHAYEDEFLATHREGREIRLRSRGRIVRDEDGQPNKMVGMIWDVTLEVEKEMEIERHRAASLASAKMATLGEMAAGIAHEVNNPLATIRGTLEVLVRKIEMGNLTPEQLTERLGYLLKLVDRISAIIKGLRLFARDGQGDSFEVEPVKGLVNEALAMCRLRFKRAGVDLEVPAIPNEWRLECRWVQVSQILLHLLNNSLDAIAEQERPWVRLQIQKEGERYTFRVTDSGLGIPAKVAEKLFQPFFTTKEVGVGTGLGLSVSQGIARAHHGELRYEAGAHTAFVLELPERQPVSIQRGEAA